MIHDLKIWPEFFEEVEANRKRAEIRKADRPFAVGDTLRLREWLNHSLEFTGQEVTRIVTYISAPFRTGDSCDFVVLSIAPEAEVDAIRELKDEVERLKAEVNGAHVKAYRETRRGFAQFIRPVALDEWSAAAKRLPADATVLKICNEIIEARTESHNLKEPTMSGTEENLKLLFAAVHKMQGQIGELQLQVQKLETGHRDDEPVKAPTPPVNDRYKFQSKHLRCATTCDQAEHDQLRLELDAEPVIPEKNLVVGGLYEVLARNLRLTVWTGKAFAGIRHKMGCDFIATETPYERNGSCDTAKPHLLVGMLPPGVCVEDDKALFDYLWKLEGRTK